MGFKENLRRLREAAGLTQTEMAKLAGVPFRSYQNWEIGTREPRIDALSSLAKACGVPVDELLGDGSSKTARAIPSTPPGGELQSVRNKGRRKGAK